MWLIFTKQGPAVKDHHVDFDDIRNIVDQYVDVTTVKNLVSSNAQSKNGFKLINLSSDTIRA